MIIDCFPFLNELDLLEIRLEELKDVVDWFVLVEASETYSGKPKPFVFEAYRDRFENYNICSLKINGFPLELFSAWHREEFTRNTLGTGIAQLRPGPDDVILFSDVDEIPRADAVREYNRVVANGETSCCVFSQVLCYYNVNLRSDRIWHGTRMVRYENMPSLHHIRTMIGKIIPNGGWHFRFLGPIQQIQAQLGAAVHAEWNAPKITDSTNIARCVADCIDLLGEGTTLQRTTVEEDLPRVLVEHPSKWDHLFRAATVNVAGELQGSSAEVHVRQTDHVQMNFRERLKQTLWNWWGDAEHPAEWDGRHYGGGKGSQRFWEYLWLLENLPSQGRILDVGAGNSLFLPELLSTEVSEVWAVDPALDTRRCHDRYRALTLEQFLFAEPSACTRFDVVTCVSVLEHIADKPGFCRFLDAFAAPVLLTFELGIEENLVTMPMVYECLTQFRNHYCTRMETCPVWADNSTFGRWRPAGIVLLPKT